LLKIKKLLYRQMQVRGDLYHGREEDPHRGRAADAL
jgi:hypothetical protein